MMIWIAITAGVIIAELLVLLFMHGASYGPDTEVLVRKGGDDKR
jgi:hypothetical protein